MVLLETQSIYWLQNREHGGRKAKRWEQTRYPPQLPQRLYARQLKFSQRLHQHFNRNLSKSHELKNRFPYNLDPLHSSPSHTARLSNCQIESLRGKVGYRSNNNVSDDPKGQSNDSLNEQQSANQNESSSNNRNSYRKDSLKSDPSNRPSSLLVDFQIDSRRSSQQKLLKDLLKWHQYELLTVLAKLPVGQSTIPLVDFLAVLPLPQGRIMPRNV
jgi:hypothetical protein